VHRKISTSSIEARPVASSFFSAALAARAWFATAREHMRRSPAAMELDGHPVSLG
jgi:hypothetical protein